MSETTQEAHVNGTAPAAPADGEAPCVDCATNGEKLLALLAGAFAVFLLVMAADMFTGGKVGGYVKERINV